MCDTCGELRVRLVRVGSAQRQYSIDELAQSGWELVGSPTMEADPETEALVFRKPPPDFKPVPGQRKVRITKLEDEPGYRVIILPDGDE